MGYGIGFAESPECFERFTSFRSNMSEYTVNSIVHMWKKQSDIIPRLESGINVLDLGCGPGIFTNVLAQRFPNSTFVGLDYSDAAIEMSNRELADRGLSNVTFVKGDAHKLPEDWTADFDMVFVYDVLHDLPDPHKTLKQIHRILKPDGFLSLIDFGFHSDPVDNAGDKTAAMFYSDCSGLNLVRAVSLQ
ncbi:S-adenosylmethionine-dependent methyltransferase Rv2258c-like isoform X2 [Mya arenaria]|uniref:S-adenosylmethionine-dependent methyltransferase Rv2258c-like isoform X2 n=1 Tax=Mya arenaria TaxID=6604 RepID=UPI0022E2CABA|nr:S-adenosylmethionine-dependent methyltransferase Rv2258c-like isoform X2 [Mya arenaria]